MALRISGVGFLPVFSQRTGLGQALYYQFTDKSDVYKYTIFSSTRISRLGFLKYNKLDPITSRRNSIIYLNVSLEADIFLLQSEYNIQYIITPVDPELAIGATWILIQSLPATFIPVFSTQHLLVWKLF